MRRPGVAPPYRLFALSNLASLVALLGYPVLVEPSVSLAPAGDRLGARLSRVRAPLGRRRACGRPGRFRSSRPREPSGEGETAAPSRGERDPLDRRWPPRVAAPAGGDGPRHPADRAGAAPLGRPARRVPPDLRGLLRVAAALLEAGLDRPAPDRARGHRVPDATGNHRAHRDVAGRPLRRRAVRLLHGVPWRDRAAPPRRAPPHDVLPPDRARRRARRAVRGGGGAAPVPSRWSSCRSASS